MSSSDLDASNLEDDPLANDEASDDCEFTVEEGDDDSFEPSACSTTDEESCSHESDTEPKRKRPKRNPPKKSRTNLEWKNESRPPSEHVKRATSSTAIIKEEHVSLDPWEIFNKYFDDPFIQLIVKLTNNEAAREGKPLKLTEAELKAYFGILIVMSFHKLPHLRCYWDRDQNLRVPRITKIMRYRRFLEIGRHLWFSTKQSAHQGQKPDFSLVRPLVDHLNEKFCQIRHPSQPLTVDVSTIRPKNWRDQLRRQSGEKHFSVLAAGCGKTGYIYRVNVRGPGKDWSECDNRVRDLMLPFEGLGTQVYIVRTLSSFPLVEELYEKKIFACCELKRNDPNIPKSLKDKPIEMETGRFVQCGDFSITKWKNSQRLSSYILSTFHDPSEKSKQKTHKSVERSNTDSETDEEEPSSAEDSAANSKKRGKCPQVVEDHNTLSEGIRIFDHLRLAYSTSWRNNSWTKRVFYYMLDVALVNSYLVYASSWESMKHEKTAKSLSCVEFRSELADSLIGRFNSNPRSGEELQVRHEVRMMKQNPDASKGLKPAAKHSTRHQDVGRHLPVKVGKIRRCAGCTMNGKEKKSTVICKACNVGLCIPCFVPFHTP